MFTKRSFFNMYAALLNMTMAMALLAGNLAFPEGVHALGLAIEVNTIADNTASDGLCSLREAIVNANANNATHADCTQGFSDDGIYFSNALGTATITLGSALPPITDHAGLVIDGGSDITVSGNNLHQVFRVHGAGSLTLDNLTVKNGRSAITNIGGGAYNAATLTIRNSTFMSNNATSGGAVFNGLGTLTIVNSKFLANVATDSGGAVYNEGGTVTVQNGSFSENIANRGGGIANTGNPAGTITITNAAFLRNHADSGGGVYNYKGKVFITSASFIRNGKDGIFNESGEVDVVKSEFSAHARNGIFNYSDGGEFNFAVLRIQDSSFTKNTGSGVYNDDAKANIFVSTFSSNRNSAVYNINESVVTIAKSTLQFNSAKYGGGIYNDGSVDEPSILHVINSTISENIAFAKGGGIYNNGEAYILSSTFSDNQAKYHGGVYNDVLGVLELYNTIVANSRDSGDDCRNEPGGTVTGNNNLIEALSGDACGFLNGVDGNIIGSDPDLGPLTSSPAYHLLNSGSLALDAGDDTQCAMVGNESQNGVTRPQGAHCEIGSYEAPAEK